MKNAYVNRVWEEVKAKNANEPEFLQAVEEVLTTLDPVVSKMPGLEKNAILERLVEPERVIQFRVPWMDDKGNYHVCLNEALHIAPTAITVGHAFGRIGCFMNGCCYGKHTDSWLGMQFTTTPDKVYPTNLYEAIFLFILSGLLFLLAMKKLGKWCFPIYMMSYGVWRFLIEYLRGDYRGSFIPGLTPSQFWSIILFLGGVAYLIVVIVLQRKGKRLII